jgi:hypothetical protein
MSGTGYKKPPVDKQFKPGKSGNPAGRPKGSRNFAADFAEELREQMTVREGGRELTISKQRALVKVLLEKALTGDIRAMTLIAQLSTKLDQDPADEKNPAVVVLDDATLDIIERYITRRAAKRDGAAE